MNMNMTMDVNMNMNMTMEMNMNTNMTMDVNTNTNGTEGAQALGGVEVSDVFSYEMVV
jgi:hypothetical protein